MKKTATTTTDWSDLETFGANSTTQSDGLITISSKTRHIRLNARLCRGLKGPKDKVVLAYSKKNNAVAFDLVKDAPNAYKLSKQSKSESLYFVPSAFLKHHNFDMSKIGGDYVPHLEEVAPQKKAWVIYLDQKTHV